MELVLQTLEPGFHFLHAGPFKKAMPSNLKNTFSYIPFIINELKLSKHSWHGLCRYPIPEAQLRQNAAAAPEKTKPTNQIKTMSTPTNYEVTTTVQASDELDDSQLEAIAGGFLDATLGSSVLGDGMLCIGGGLINSKMELNL